MKEIARKSGEKERCYRDQRGIKTNGKRYRNIKWCGQKTERGKGEGKVQIEIKTEIDSKERKPKFGNKRKKGD